MTRVGLSATVAPIGEVARFLVGDRDCKIIDVQFIKELDLKVLSPVKDLIDTTHERMRREMYNLMHRLIQDHKTTLIFTNTRAATERVVDTLKNMFPKHYQGNIGAHHGSLSKGFRHGIEERLRKGELKVVVSSTSLELGIDIGHIDLVILLGSPKSVARALQRIGRSGHALHAKTKGRIIVLDRDDLVECSVLLKSAIEKKIDKIHIPKNALDVLVQHVYGMAIDGILEDGTYRPIMLDEMFEIIRRAYPFKNLNYNDFMQIIDYLAGNYVDLEERHIYQKIYIEERVVDGKNRTSIRARGKLSRMLYMTNLGTIPDESNVIVKVGNEIIGSIDEVFLERLNKGDVFVLGGETYEFLYSRGTVAHVKATSGRPPTVPSWFSQMLPLSFDLANEIGRFRRLMEEKLSRESQEKIIEFINNYLYVDNKAAESLYRFFKEQYEYAIIPHDKKIVIEYSEGKAIFHTLYGRRVNDALSRAVAYVIGKTTKMNVEIGITDNGFYLTAKKRIDGKKALEMLKHDKLRLILEMAIDNSEVLKRRFRHCATRSLMILRNYMGRRKRVGRQAVSSTILLNAVRRIGNDFAILKEARREVLEDVMDIANAEYVVGNIEKGKVKIVEIDRKIPSPFAFNLSLQGFLDVLKIDDKIEFLRQMHREIMKEIDGKSSRDINDIKDRFKKEKKNENYGNRKLIELIRPLPIDDRFKIELIELVRKGTPLSNTLMKLFEEKGNLWPKRLRDFIGRQIQNNFSYDAYWGDDEDTERALIDFQKAARKKKLSNSIVEDISKMIIMKDKAFLREESKEWLSDFLSKAIPFVWSDHVVKYLRQIWEK